MNPPEEATATAPRTPPTPAHRPRRRWRGSLLALLLVALVGGGAWYLIQRANGGLGGAGGAPGRGGPGGPGGGRPLVTVGEATARKAELPVVIDALGTVVSATTVTLRPQVSGQLAQVLFTEGQMVQKGQLLAQIDPRPFEQVLM